MAVRREILAILKEECELASAPALADPLADLDVDSMAIVCAVHALEDRFDIDLPLEIDLTRFRTVGDLVETVERLVANRAPGGAAPPPALR